MARPSAKASPIKRRALRLRSGDQVLVISGKDRGKKGRILRVEPRKERVYVEGLNMVKRHTRPRENQTQSRATAAQLGGVIEREGPIHISNVVLLDHKGQPTRVRIERTDGKRSRIAARTGAAID